MHFIIFFMLQSSVMLYSKSTKHKLVMMQEQAFEWENQWSKLRDSSRWPPGSISPLNQLINRPSCGRSVPVNWGGTNWTILRTLSALWLITRGKSDIHLIETHRDWCGTAFGHLVRLQRNRAKGFVLKVHVYFHISGYLFVCLWLKRLEGAKSDCIDL